MTGMMLILSCSCFMNSMSRGFKPKEQQRLSIEESKPEERPTMPRWRNKVKTGVNPAISHVWVSGNLKLQWGKKSPSITTLPVSLPRGKPRTETRRSWGLVPSNLSCPLRHQSQACPLKCWHNSHLVLLVFHFIIQGDVPLPIVRVKLTPAPSLSSTLWVSTWNWQVTGWKGFDGIKTWTVFFSLKLGPGWASE